MRRGLGSCALAIWLLALGSPAATWALGSPSFATAPALPSLPAVTLNAGSQTISTKMTEFAIKEPLLENSGWNVTVAGQSGTGKSAVFAQYCPLAGGCGSDPFGYVASGKQLPAGSLTLSSSGASFTGGSGTAPTLQCSTPCAVDSASANKVASQSGTSLLGNTWTASGFSSSSLKLATTPSLRVLPSNEVYRVNLIWTLSTGP